MTSIRHSILAGEWYPDDPEDLKEMIQGYLNRVPEKKTAEKLVGLISPHAGYVYSGFTAAHGYKELIGKSYEVVVVMSPFHSYPSGKYMIHTASAYETPLGRIPVGLDLIKQLKREVEITELTHEEEHSIEIQLPFLQMTLEKFFLLPIMVWNPNVWQVEDMVLALQKILKGKNALMVASTDLHHIHSYSEVKSRDTKVAEALEKFNLKEIRTVLESDDCTVCGKVPVSIVVDVAKRMGANQLEVLYRSNSRDEYNGVYTGTYTVGYLSAVISGK